MSNSEAYNLGYQIGQALGFLTLVGFCLAVYFFVRYLVKKRKKKELDDIE